MKHELIDIATPLVVRLAPGTRFDLPELLGEKWEDFAATHGSQHAGRVFSDLITSGEIPDVRFVEVRRTPRISVYIKIDIK